MFELATKPLFLITLCALGYAVATVAMKMASDTPHIIIYAAIAACLVAAVAGEVLLLQRTHLGIAYIAILGVETVIVLLVAAFMGEGLSGREVAGGLIVLVGAGVLST
jgi:drug/metabolite transporter (DMT)-like permease